MDIRKGKIGLPVYIISKPRTFVRGFFFAHQYTNAIMRENIKRLFGILDKWKWGYVFSGILLIISVAIRMMEPKVIQIAIDHVIEFYVSGKQQALSSDAITDMFYYFLPELTLDSLKRSLLILGAIYMVIAIVRGMIMLFANAMTASTTEKAIKSLRDRLFSHIQALPLNYHSNISTGELIQRCTGDVDTVRKFMLNQVVDIIRLSAIFLFAFIMIWLIEWRFAMLSIMFIPILFFGGYFFFKMEGKVWEDHEKEADKLTNIAQENLNGIRVVKAFAREAFEIDKFENQNLKKLAMGLKHVKLHAMFWPVSDFFVYAQFSISFIIGGLFAFNGIITIGELAGIYTYAIMVTWPMRQIGRILSQMGMAVVAIGRIYEVLDEVKEDYQGDEIPSSLNGDIEFRNVSFKYNDDVKEHVLENVSFKIKAGEKVAFIGKTGSGKSTIIKLLTRFYEPSSGMILVDGKNINGVSKYALRQRIGVVLQKPFLFSTTIRENIAYAKPDASHDAVMHAAEVASIGHIHEILPEGVDTVVGEKGVTLSGGQKQRVALARTILSKPDIIVLDDITSAVDTETEHEILNALQDEMLQKTTIIISHRFTSITQANRVIVMDEGKIAEQGSHKELVSMEGYYKKIFNLQNSLEVEIERELNMNGKENSNKNNHS